MNGDSPSLSGVNPPQGVPAPPAVNRRWLVVVRVLCALNVLIVWPFVFGWLMAFPFGLIPIAGFFWVAASSQRGLYAQNPKRGLALGLADGAAALLMLFPLALVFTNGFASWDWPSAGMVAGAALVSISLVASAILALRTAGTDPKGGRLLGAALLHGFAYLGVPLLGAAIIIPSVVRSPIAANQASAVGSLRTINTAMITYESTYQNGFAPSLKTLGPPSPPPSGGPTTAATPSCQEAGLIDEILASGRKSGYIFELRPGPLVENTPPGCPAGVKSYTVTARPVSRKTGHDSYFTDQTGIIRFTEEDRPATAKDPPLGG